MRLTNNTIHSISKSSNIRMGLSFAKESHAEFLNRFCLCQDRIKDIFEIEKGTSITESQAVEGNIPVVAGGKDYAYLHNESNRPQGCITISASGANSGFVNYWDVPILGVGLRNTKIKRRGQVFDEIFILCSSPNSE